MDIYNMLHTGEGIEHLEDYLLDLDSEFRFKCRRCGKCCIHQDTILLKAKDIFNIAKKQGRTMRDVIKAYTEVYIGRNSRVPVVHLLSNGPKGACPLLVDGRCSVHDCKPDVCALFPLGRTIINKPDDEAANGEEQLKVRYIINDYNCGSAKRVNTVRSWLARFGIPEHDEYFILWNKVIFALTPAIQKLEDGDFPVEGLRTIWRTIFAAMYLDYDMEQEFMPQFQVAAEKLIKLGKAIMENPIPNFDSKDWLADTDGENAEKGT